MSFLRHQPVGPTAEPEGMGLDSGPESDSRSTPVSFARTGLIGRCANPDCRSGWVHLFRRRSTPIFEGGWTCSPQCTEALLLGAVRRELDDRQPARETHRHRIPLGLLMMEQGWITSKQLRDALEAQKAAERGRLGNWLVLQHATDEATVTRALGLQWSCPVPPTEFAGPAALTSVMPRLFLDAFGVLPLRVAADKVLYLGFEQSPDSILAFAVGRMSGMRVESAIVPSSVFHKAQSNMLAEQFPTVQLAEAVSESAAAHLLARSIERHQPAEARLVRTHDCLWLRMWLARDSRTVPGVRSVFDVVCSIGAF
jgi:Type II secretion system (T2SS), protein E, N-terminal domain